MNYIVRDTQCNGGADREIELLLCVDTIWPSRVHVNEGENG